jgi:hypothetical protein
MHLDHADPSIYRAVIAPPRSSPWPGRAGGALGPVTRGGRAGRRTLRYAPEPSSTSSRPTRPERAVGGRGPREPAPRLASAPRGARGEPPVPGRRATRFLKDVMHLGHAAPSIYPAVIAPPRSSPWSGRAGGALGPVTRGGRVGRRTLRYAPEPSSTSSRPTRPERAVGGRGPQEPAPRLANAPRGARGEPPVPGRRATRFPKDVMHLGHAAPSIYRAVIAPPRSFSRPVRAGGAVTGCRGRTSFA